VCVRATSVARKTGNNFRECPLLSDYSAPDRRPSGRGLSACDGADRGRCQRAWREELEATIEAIVLVRPEPDENPPTESSEEPCLCA
jgi:hypothetical protein